MKPSLPSILGKVQSSSMEHTIKSLKDWRSAGSTVVLATGVFDILHIEHIRFLKAAKKAGDRLLVGIETDARVKSMKGHHRPVNSQDIRLEQISSLKPVDHSLLLPTQFNTQPDWDRFMAQIRPDVYAVSSHTTYLKNKQRLVEKYGGKLAIVHQFNPAYSTTKFYRHLVSQI
jgi:rfaE bifunctional protein nucleotidyltransferase chain/domain